MPKATTSVRLDQETLDRLSALAEATGRKRGSLMTHAIEKYVETESWQVAAIQQAVDTLEAGTASLVDHGAVSAWLQSWGTEHEQDAPA